MGPYKKQKLVQCRDINIPTGYCAHISCHAPLAKRKRSPANVGWNSKPHIIFRNLKRRHRRKFSAANTLNLGAAMPRHHSPPSVIEQLPKLRWLYDLSWDKYRRAWASFTRASTYTATQPLIKPDWSQIPSRCPDAAVDKYMYHLSRIWNSVQSLEIPVCWNVLDAVDWSRRNAPTFACTDSSDGHQIREPLTDTSLRSFPDFPCESESETAINCSGNKIAHARARGQWNFFTTIQPKNFYWNPQTIERSLCRDERRHSGVVDLNQSAHNHDIWPQNAFSALLAHCTGDKYRMPLQYDLEVPWKCIIGRRLVNVVETEMFPARYEKSIRWPESLRDSRPPLVVDYTCRATPQYMGWHEDLCPLLFAAQYYRQGRSDYMATQALASVFRPMMMLFIIYFLDTRKSVSDIMPPWMVLFGIVYTENGVHVYGHCLCCIPPTHPDIPVNEGGEWRGMSYPMNGFHRLTFLEPPAGRGSLLCTLNRIQGHCRYVLNQLKAWDGKWISDSFEDSLIISNS